MSRDLKETMLQSAAATYGSKHYRGILAMHSLRRVWPVAILLPVLAGLGYLLLPAVDAAEKHPSLVGAAIVGALILLALITLVVRRVRSPYRRRRFR